MDSFGRSCGPNGKEARDLDSALRSPSFGAQQSGLIPSTSAQGPALSTAAASSHNAGLPDDSVADTTSSTAPIPISAQMSMAASAATIARAISPPTPAPSPQPSSNSIRLAQAHAHARAMAAAAESSSSGAGPSSALAHSYTAMPSTPPHQEDVKLELSPPASEKGISLEASSKVDRTLDGLHSHLLSTFPTLSRSERLTFLSALIPLSTARELAHLQNLIVPNLKVDFLSTLPYELSLHILSFIDDPITLARCSAVSRQWRALVNDEGTWMAMCKKQGRARSSVPGAGSRRAVSFGSFGFKAPSPQSFSYRNHIKLAYLTDSNWRRGGRVLTTHQTLAPQTVTSLAIDRDWIVIGMASSKIHVFDARTGLYFATLSGHETGVWSLAMVSGSRRRDTIDIDDIDAIATHKKSTVLPIDDSQEYSSQTLDADGDVSMGDTDTRADKKRRLGSKTLPAGSSQQSPLHGRDKGKQKRSDSGPAEGSSRAPSTKLSSAWNPRTRAKGSSTESEQSKSARSDRWALPSQESEAAEHDEEEDDGEDKGDEDEQDDEEDQSEGMEDVESNTPHYNDSGTPQYGLNPRRQPDESGPAYGIVDPDQRRRPYKRVGDDELQLTYYDAKPCEDMDTLYAAAEDSYADTHPMLPFQHSVGPSNSSHGPPGFRDSNTRAVSTSAAFVTPSHGRAESALLPPPAGPSLGVEPGVLGLIGGNGIDQVPPPAAGGAANNIGPRFGLFGRGFRESPSARQHVQRVTFGVSSSSSNQATETSSSSNGVAGASLRRSLPAEPRVRMTGVGNGRPSATQARASTGFQIPTGISSYSQDDAAEARMAWNALGLPRTGNAVGLGNPCGSSAGFGNEDAIIVSGSCDRQVRVWDLKTKSCKFVLNGHNSTVRCLKVLDGRPIAISGSRDTDIRIWDLNMGKLLHLCVGHTGSVRCLEVAGNRVVSGSYDNTCRIWDVETGQCLHVLEGHHHFIYAVAFDGRRVATGSLDTTIRVWDADTGDCLALFQGHTSLVGHLQLRDDILVSGGSDGRVIVFSLKTFECLHRLCAHDNSVTSLQFDDRFIVTGANDGHVKIWDFRTGKLLRELIEVTPGAVVWKVSFKDDKVVALYTKDEKTVMDVISFRPLANQ
ncbi:hypothetical protein OC861_000508 [Tilletia horrida]|nr:hypothetical protein OC861_000508 [Tilletia horrida]